MSSPWDKAEPTNSLRIGETCGSYQAQKMVATQSCVQSLKKPVLLSMRVPRPGGISSKFRDTMEDPKLRASDEDDNSAGLP